MPSINDLRQMYPGYAGLRDEEIINDMAEANGVDAGVMASHLGWERPTFGKELVRAVKRTGGTIMSGAGEIGNDLGLKDNALMRYGHEVEQANPSGINSLADIADYPAAALGNALGNAATMIVPGAGLQLTGKALQAAKYANAARMVSNPVTQAAVAGLPSLGSIGDAQRESGEGENLALKYGASGLVGAIENLGGVQRMMGFGGQKGARTIAEQAAEFGATPWRTFGKQLGRSMLEEGGEEILQNPIEQYASYKNPMTAESLEETAFGGAMGALGGGIGGYHAARTGMKHASIRRGIATDLLNTDQPLTRQANLAQWESAFKDKAGEDGSSWYNQFMDEQNNARLGAVGAPSTMFGAFQQDMTGRLGEVALEDSSMYGPVQTPVDQYLQGIRNRRQVFSGLQANAEPGLAEDPDMLAHSAAMNAPTMVHAGLQIPGSFNYNVGLPVSQQILDEEESGYVPTQVAQAGSAGASGVASGSAGNLANQPGLGVGGSQPAGTSVVGSGANPLVGSAGTGVSNVKQAKKGRTLADYISAVDRLYQPGSQEHADLVSQMQQSKGANKALKLLATSSKEGFLVAYEFASPNEREVLRVAMGLDEQGNQTSPVIPKYADIAKAIGKKDRQYVQNILAKYGINAQVLNQMHAVQQDTVNIAELVPSQQGEDGVNEGGTGFRVTTTPNGSDDIVDDRRTRVETQQANKWMVENTGSIKGEVAPAEPIAPTEEQKARARQEADRAILADAKAVAGIHAEEAMSSWNEIAEESDTGVPFHELDGRTQALWLVEYADLIKQHYGEVTDAQLYSMIEQLYNDYASDTRIENESGKIQATRAGGSGRIGSNDAGTSSEVRGLEEKSGQALRVPVEVPEGKPLPNEATGRGDSETENGEVSRGKTQFSEAPTTAVDRLQKEVERWTEVVDQYLTRAIDRTKTHLFLSSTPASLQAMGLPNLEVRAGVHMLDNANVRLTREQMADLPNQLANPLMAYIHDGDKGLSFNFVTEFKNGGQVVIALKPTQASNANGKYHFVATVLNLPQQRILGEFRNGHGVYVSSKDAWPGLREAVDFAQKQKGREASEVRAQMARTYGLASVPKRLLFKSDLVKLVAEGKAQFSEGRKGGVGADSLRSTLAKYFFSGDRFNKLVSIYGGVSEIPESVKAAAAADAHMSVSDVPWNRVQGFTVGGKVYLIANNIKQGNELSVFLHELGVHIGMEKLLGVENFKRLSAQVDKWAQRSDNSLETRLAKEAVRRAGESSSADREQELVAYFVEEAVEAGVNPTALQKESSSLQQWFRSLWNAMKAALTKIGMTRFDQLSAQNIVDLAYGAADMEINAEGAITGTAATQFSESKTLDRIEQYGGSSARSAVETAGDLSKRAFKWFMSLHDLINESKGILKSAQPWYDSVRATIAARNRMEQKAEAIAARVAKLPSRAIVDALNEFVASSTYEQKWGYDVTLTRADGSKVQIKADPGMAQKFAKLNALSKEAGNIAKDIFAHGEEMKRRKLEVLTSAKVDPMVFKTGTLQGPYAPLKRFGNEVVVLKSQDLLNAEKPKNGAPKDEKLIEKLKADPKHYIVAFFDARGEASAFARAKAKDYAFQDVFTKNENLDVGHQMKTETLTKIRAALKLEGIDPKAKQQLERMIEEMYLKAYDEHSHRMSGLQRKNYEGYDKDMVRSFLAHARAEAAFIANMEHGGKTNELYYKLQNEVKDESGKRVGQEWFRAITKHYIANLDHTDTPIQDRVLTLTSVMQLATNPAYHLQNLLQPTMVTVPRLAADFKNYGAAWDALRQGYAIVREAVSGGLFSVNIDPTKVKNQKLRDMLVKVQEAGLLDVGMDEDTTQFEQTRTGVKLADEGTKLFKTAVHKMRQVSRRLEATNRISAAVAAFNLHYAKNRNEDAATEYAISVLQDTQGDFSKTDAPLIIKKLPKVVVQYRKFQLMMAAHYVKAFRDAFRSEDPETRAVGRRILAYSLGHAFLASGAMGLPLMNLAALAFAATGDDDEPRDLERSLRNLIGDETSANLLLRSPLYLFGLDAKLAQDKVFSILPYADWDLTSKQGVTNLALGAMGPSMSNAAKMAEGLGNMAKGEYTKGLIGLLPSGLSNAVKAFDLANEGYRLKGGDVMVKPEDISTFQMLTDSLGLKSVDTRRLDWIKSQHWEIDQFYSERTKAIQRGYAEAVKEGDTEAMAEAREDWAALQDGKDRLRYLYNDSLTELKRQPLSNLLKYPQTKAKREEKLQRSIPQ